MNIKQPHRNTQSDAMDRLTTLINARVQPGADKARIDQEIWSAFGERWAIMMTDLAGFSRGAAEFGIIHFLQVIAESERLFEPLIRSHDGILIKTEADSLILLFKDPKGAVDCAIEMQRSCADYNRGKAKEEQILLCVGLGFGDILKVGDEDVFGAEVNAASKLGEDTAEPWEILVTDATRKAVEGAPDTEFERLDYAPYGTKAAFRLRYKL